MKLELKIINESSNIQVLSLVSSESGHVTPLGDEFARICQGPPVQLILNVQTAEGLNGSGITALISARNEIVNRGGKVVLIGANSRVRMMINISGLDKYFPIVVSEADAIQLLNTSV